MKTIRLVVTVVAPNKATREEVAKALDTMLIAGQETMKDALILGKREQALIRAIEIGTTE